MARRPTPPTLSRSPHHADLRHRLLQAALQALESEGIDELSLRRIARRAGVSSGAPFHHFADKNELMGALAEQGFLELAAALAQATARAGIDPERRLRSLSTAYLAFARDHRALFSVMFRRWLPLEKTPDLPAAAEYALSPLLQALREVHGGREQGLASLGWAMLHGIATLSSEGPRADLFTLETRSLTESAVSLLLGTPRPTAAPSATKRPRKRR